ncbi:MAG: Holliday junction resolvase RuvX [Planctomycetes bacterium]|nr:Holliday junction resolvase RuvX [Planctomycetota bacterium]
MTLPGQRRVLAVDPGAVRVGLAYSDALGISLMSAGVLKGGSGAAQRIAGSALELDAAAVVVGHPVNMDGSAGKEAAKARALALSLARLLPGIDIYLWDERLSSHEATGILQKANRKPGRNKHEVDVLSAKLILRSFLDAERAGNAVEPLAPPEEE